MNAAEVMRRILERYGLPVEIRTALVDLWEEHKDDVEYAALWRDLIELEQRDLLVITTYDELL